MLLRGELPQFSNTVCDLLGFDLCIVDGCDCMDYRHAKLINGSIRIEYWWWVRERFKCRHNWKIFCVIRSCLMEWLLLVFVCVCVFIDWVAFCSAILTIGLLMILRIMDLWISSSHSSSSIFKPSSQIILNYITKRLFIFFVKFH